MLLLALAASLAAVQARAQPEIGSWEVCRATAGPVLTDCRPQIGPLDPQGREIWLRARVGPLGHAPSALHLAGAMSTEVWFNGVRVGANGQPGPTTTAERPGRYQADIEIPAALWRPVGNELVLRMSAHHVGLHLDRPVAGVWIGEDDASFLAGTLAVTCTAAGALLAAAFGFGAVYGIRRTASSLNLAGLAGVAALQAIAENVRNLVRYDYPLHVWRLGVIWALSVTFAVLLAAFFASRFAPTRRTRLVSVAAGLACASCLVPGFDQKTALALLAGVGVAGVAAGLGVRSRLPGARPALAYLAAFLGVAFAAPGWLLDLSFFILAAGLTLPLLVAEVVRLGRDDRDREAALTRAASRPDRLTVATAKGVQLVPLADIVAVTGADDYVELRLRGGRTLLHAARLDRLEAQLPTSFLRVHRSAIANLSHVERLERDGSRWGLHLSEGSPLPVSRARLATVREALDAEPAPLRVPA